MEHQKKETKLYKALTKLEKILFGIIFIGTIYIVFSSGLVNVIIDSETKSLIFSLN